MTSNADIQPGIAPLSDERRDELLRKNHALIESRWPEFLAQHRLEYVLVAGDGECAFGVDPIELIKNTPPHKRTTAELRYIVESYDQAPLEVSVFGMRRDPDADRHALDEEFRAFERNSQYVIDHWDELLAAHPNEFVFVFGDGEVRFGKDPTALVAGVSREEAGVGKLQLLIERPFGVI